MHSRAILVVVTGILCLSASVWGTTLYVPDDFVNIQDAISASVTNDTILVRPGMYPERVTFGSAKIVLKSTDGAASTVIIFPTTQPAANNDGVIRFTSQSASNSVVDGFTIDGIDRVNGVSADHCSPTIRNCIIQNGRGSYDGGGLWLNMCRPVVEDNIIRYCHTGISGGGIFIRLGIFDGAARFTGNTIYGNVAGNAGGICAIEGRGAYMARNVIYNNTVSPTQTEGEGAITIRAADCTILNNTVADNYGGITMAASANAKVWNNIVAGNVRGIRANDYVGPSEYALGYNVVWNNGTTNYNNVAPGVTDISSDPLFIPGTYYISLASPCYNGGDPDPIYNDPDGSRNDIGANPYTFIEPRMPKSYYVPDDFATIGAAVMAAIDEDTILVKPGVYDERVAFEGRSIVLKSTDGPRETIIRFPASIGSIYDDGVLFLGPGSDSRTLIEGFTIDGTDRVNGISCTYSNPTIRECIIEHGAGTWDGGGLWLDHCRPTVEFNTIRYNRTWVSGGGVFIRLGDADGQARITNNVISGNVGGNAGGICAIEGRGAYIARNLIYNNTVSPTYTEGEGAITIRADDCVILNNTIADNYAGITLAASHNADVRNNIVVGGGKGIWANDYAGTSAAALAYNDVWGNAINYVNIEPGVTDISVDPLFASCSHELSSLSPCIDAGDPDPVYNDPDGSRNDMGYASFMGFVSYPKTIHVPDDFASIQDAIDYAGCEDTILVSPGEYGGHLNFGGKSLVLRSVSGAEATRLIPPVVKSAPEKSPGGGQLDQAQMLDMHEHEYAVGALITLTPGSGQSTVIDGFTLDGKEVNEGIHCLQSGPAIRNCVIENCVGAYDGGGLWFQHCSPLVENNIIRYNRTPISGGGIFIRLGYGYTPRFVGNQIYGNVGGNGGGIVAIEGEGAIIERNLIYDNHVFPPQTEGWGAVTIRADNCKIVNNTIVANDGGVTIIYSENVDVRNNIIVNNLAGGLIRNDYVGEPINFTHDYNDIWGNNDKDYVLLSPNAGEISIDPQFLGTVEPGAENPVEAFYITAASPCFDAGDPDAKYNDLDGSRNDMGAFPASLPTSVAGNESRLPTEFALLQNYPNPCNPSTMISFSLPTSSHATLVVYNLLGQEVRRLVDEDLSAGVHRIEWDGRSSEGVSVATGIYLYHLEAGGKQQTNKMLMMK